MNQQKLRPFIVIGLVLFITLSIVTVLRTGAVQAQGECTLSTIQGTYIFEAQGVHVEDDGSVLPYAEAGTWTLDGEGNAVGVLSASIDGVAFARGEPFTATYALKSGCVYTAVDAFGLEYQ